MIYIPVFAMLLLFDSFFIPLKNLMLILCAGQFSDSGVWPCILRRLYDDISRPESIDTVFSLDESMMLLINQAALLLTWGLVFPPLAIMACFAIVVRSYHIQLSIGRRLYLARHDNSMLLMINHECEKIPLIVGQSEMPLVGVSSFVCSILLFDTLCDTQGFSLSYWIAIVMISGPCIVYGGVSWLTRKLSKDQDKDQGSGNRKNELDVKEVVENAIQFPVNNLVDHL
jgi:hypothetical protein